MARGQGLFAGEKSAVPFVDAAQDLGDVGVEAAQVAIPGQSRHASAVLVVGRQTMGLLVVQHLHPMLEAAERLIGRSEFGGVGLIDLTSSRQRVQGFQRPRRAKTAVAATQDKLLRLNEKFDLADAPAAELEIRTGGGQPVIHLVDVDLPLDRMDVGDRCEIEIASPDEWRELEEEGLPAREVAGDRPCLDERRPFPVLSNTLVIAKSFARRHSRRSRGGVGSKPQIDAKDIALGRAALKQRGHALDGANRHGMGLGSSDAGIASGS